MTRAPPWQRSTGCVHLTLAKDRQVRACVLAQPFGDASVGQLISLAYITRITRYVEHYPPSIVECRFDDASGRTWHFIDKLPMFTADDLRPESNYPQPGMIACEIERTWLDSEDREVCSINTEQPWFIEAITGETRFDVLASQLCEC